MRKLLLAAILMVISSFVMFAQTEMTAFTAAGGGYSTTYLNDYQCLGINPANLGWQKNSQRFNLGFLEFSGSLYSEPLSRKQIFNDLLDIDFQLSVEEKMQAAKNFADARFFGAASLMYLGFSYQDENFGGIAFNIRERLIWQSYYNQQSANFLFMGWRDPYFDQKILNQAGDTIEAISSNPLYSAQICGNSNMNYFHVREFNLGYGRKIISFNDHVDWYMGVNLKYLVGFAAFQYNQYMDGDIIGFSAFSPFYGVEHDEPTPSAIDGTGLKKSGTGFGIDLGTSFQVFDDFKIGFALNDIGQINWNGNAYDGYNVRAYKIDSEGINNYNAFEQGGLISVDAHPDDPEDWQGVEGKKIKLPMHLRAGASYRFADWVEAGTDLYVPMGEKVPGIYESPVFGIGANFEPAAWVQLSTGLVTGGETGTSIPLGIVFRQINNEASWLIGIASGDISTLFINNNPKLSVCTGFLRFVF
jgi:hypothetical protein